MGSVISSTFTANTRSGIKMPTTAGRGLDLIFLLSPTSPQLCSGSYPISHNSRITFTDNDALIGNNFCGVDPGCDSYVT